MKRKLCHSYWWPGQNKIIENFIKHCVVCQLLDKSLTLAYISATSIPLPEVSCQKVAIDISGPFLIAPHSSKFLAVIIDYKSKFSDILITSNVPHGQQLDGWTRFSIGLEHRRIWSVIMVSIHQHRITTFLQKYNIRHTPSAVCNPQVNGVWDASIKIWSVEFRLFTPTARPGHRASKPYSATVVPHV
ncbi:integrase core domain protein [Plakobranchus ocellatus]|uniref:Integrase core domain protein n=1 Tax=Plakobranchus ocellatus TaxID=259542 RepID=A0AAV4DYK0_9GAST|nr:integrase core domain protein [Plakobranchus ocellatus]